MATCYCGTTFFVNDHTSLHQPKRNGCELKLSLQVSDLDLSCVDVADHS